tara:strand:- start:252 stop:464 length:213 start_codon:yes stop_codon:yes gene_type:complete
MKHYRKEKEMLSNRYTEMYEEYSVYKEESKACGYEVKSYQEWLGEIDAREKAFIRISRHVKEFGNDAEER